jgi:hypothetical protein
VAVPSPDERVPVRRGRDVVRALLCGVFVPDAVTGRVLSLHASAVNILEEASGLLVSLLVREQDMTAMGVLVPRLPPSSRPGETVSGPGMRLGDGGVVLAGAPIWEGRIARVPALDRRRVASLAAALLSCGAPGGLLGLLDGRDANPFGARARALLAAASGSVREGALVGLGPGFTPSGDDFLAGALAAEECGAHGPAVNRESIRAGLGRTTPGGRTLLTLALRGSYPAYLLRFVARLDSLRSAEELRVAVREAVAHGETSGTDALVGFLWRLGGCRGFAAARCGSAAPAGARHQGGRRNAGSHSSSSRASY